MTVLLCVYSHQEGWTALIWAALNGHLEVVVKLAELGVDLSLLVYGVVLNQTNTTGTTQLKINGNTNVVVQFKCHSSGACHK